MYARWIAFIVWAAVAASSAFWALRLFVAAPAMPPQAVPVGAAEAPRGDLARLFGRPATTPSAAAEPPAPSRFKLIGVVAPRQERDAEAALALIAIDDQPAKAYRVGAVVDGETVLQEVRPRGASLGPRGGPGMSLELAPPAAAATGSLPTAGAPAQIPVPMPVPVPVMPAQPLQPANAPDSAPGIEPPAAMPARQGPQTM